MTEALRYCLKRGTRRIRTTVLGGGRFKPVHSHCEGTNAWKGKVPQNTDLRRFSNYLLARSVPAFAQRAIRWERSTSQPNTTGAPRLSVLSCISRLAKTGCRLRCVARMDTLRRQQPR